MGRIKVEVKVTGGTPEEIEALAREYGLEGESAADIRAEAAGRLEDNAVGHLMEIVRPY